MNINQNIALLQAYNQYSTYSQRASQSMERLATGSRINRASDDASGLMQSENLRIEIRGAEQARKNIGDAKSLIDVADGAMASQTKLLERVHELALKASNEILGDEEMKAIQEEVDDLLEEVGDIANETTYNGKKVLNGEADFDITVGAHGEKINIDIRDMDTNYLGYTATTLNKFEWGGGMELTVNKDNASVLAGNVDKAIRQITAERANLGATRNRLDFRSEALLDRSTHLSKSDARIRDVDVAKETLEMTKNQMLMDASMSMMSQGMLNNQQVLRLLQ
ncbi:MULTISPECIES: flagellin [unclassified Exiguobacterium]|uniref:flagellin N-terminal helical domain-containing protein n=1 Tax=unclassified Exiguobacterium TaxID=2644629 RepID=UPI001BE6C7B1|nr:MULTISPECIES: flagellin [unclassified Exiguobacterium]